MAHEELFRKSSDCLVAQVFNLCQRRLKPAATRNFHDLWVGHRPMSNYPEKFYEWWHRRLACAVGRGDPAPTDILFIIYG